MLALWVVFAANALGLDPGAGPVDWARDIQPLFVEYCHGCHAATVTMGSLNLETYGGVLKGGNHGTIVVRGKPRESRLYTMLTGETSPFMPMDGKVLAPAQIAMVGAWIAAGADGPAPTQAYSLAWSPDGARVAIGGYKKVTFSDQSPEWTGLGDAVRAVAYSPSGKLLAAGGVCGRRGEIVVKDGPRINGHADCIYAAAFSPDGKTIASASYDKLIKIWDAETGQELRTLKDHIDAVYALAFTPDGKRLVSASADRGVKVWSLESGERLYSLTESTDGLNTVAVSPDGKLAAAGGLDKNIRIWTLGEKAGELVVSQIAHEDAILRLAFAPDGRTIVSASADRRLKRFAVTDLAELGTIGMQPDWVTGMAYSPDGKRLAVVRMDGSFQIYPEVKPQ